MALKSATRMLPCSLLVSLAAGVAGAQQASVTKDATVWEVGPMAAPVPVKRPAEMMPSPPKVKCEGDQLTIRAENSTMRSILAAVQGCSGIQMDVPPAGGEERTYLQLGPGPVREVMDALLSSTDLDYVIEPSSTAPDKVGKILLIAREKDPGAPGGTTVAANVAMTPMRRAWLASRNNTGRAVASSSAESDQGSPAEEGPIAQSAPEAATASVAEAAPAPAGSAGKEAADAGTQVTEASAAGAEDKAATPRPAGDPADASASGATNVQNSGNSQASTASDAAQDPGAKELQNKITDMQQLFEQRKKIAAAQSAGTSQN